MSKEAQEQLDEFRRIELVRIRVEHKVVKLVTRSWIFLVITCLLNIAMDVIGYSSVLALIPLVFGVEQGLHALWEAWRLAVLRVESRALLGALVQYKESKANGNGDWSFGVVKSVLPEEESDSNEYAGR